MQPKVKVYLSVCPLLHAAQPQRAVCQGQADGQAVRLKRRAGDGHHPAVRYPVPGGVQMGRHGLHHGHDLLGFPVAAVSVYQCAAASVYSPVLPETGRGVQYAPLCAANDSYQRLLVDHRFVRPVYSDLFQGRGGQRPLCRVL